jgi:hypothetical protein
VTPEEYILNWIEDISKKHPDLNGFSICPFSKKYSFKIVKCSINDINPLPEEYGVVIFVVEDDLSIDYIQEKVKEFNNTYQKYTFFEDLRDYSSYINSYQTNNQKYNLILYQDREFLTNLRKKLALTSYYDSWDDDYLQKILGDDYKIVQNIRNK